MIIVNSIDDFVNYNNNFTPIYPFPLISNNSLAISLTPLTCTRKLYFYFSCQDLVDEQLMPPSTDTSSINADGVQQDTEESQISSAG